MDLGAVPSTSTTLFAGVNSFDMLSKKIDFVRLRNCRLLYPQGASDVRSKKVNANDNFANDNFEFAKVAVAA